ncbi:MAG: hypothetical protein HY735_35585 [Verrucomicrobia bacterium]|nr:hypothetical protein [Verrucomicrobiota bacterium]
MNQTEALDSTGAAQKIPHFPWRLFLAALALIISGHVFSVAVHDFAWEALHFWALVLTGAAVGGLIWCAWDIYQRRLEHSVPLPSLLGSVLASHWLALDLHHALHLPWWLLFVGGVLVFLLVASQAHHWQHELEMGRSLRRELATDYVLKRPIRALVLVVSKPTSMPLFASETSVFPVTVPVPKNVQGKPSPAELSGKLADDIRNNGPKALGWTWNWQQTLRAIEPHVPKVERVWMIGSEDNYLTSALRLLRGYLPALSGDAVNLVPAVDLEKFDNLMLALRFILLGAIDPDELQSLEIGNPALANFLRSHVAHLCESYAAHEVAVDITGGIKIASVAGAVLTLNHAVVCQYVQSEGLLVKGDLQPYIYDFRWDPSLRLH